MSCEWSALEAIQQLIRSGNLTGLDLSGCWTPEGNQPEGNQQRPEETSLAGSGSTGTAASSADGMIKTKEEGAKAAEVKQFLSLPRRTRGSRSYSSLTRGLTAVASSTSATASASSSYLSRNDEKRRSDSMLFQKVLLPLPACDRSAHLHCGFHLLFESLRNLTCHLTQLNLSKSSITVADAMCLGESLRKNRTLVSLRLQGSLWLPAY